MRTIWFWFYFLIRSRFFVKQQKSNVGCNELLITIWMKNTHSGTRLTIQSITDLNRINLHYWEFCRNGMGTFWMRNQTFSREQFFRPRIIFRLQSTSIIIGISRSEWVQICIHFVWFSDLIWLLCQKKLIMKPNLIENITKISID